MKNLATLLLIGFVVLLGACQPAQETEQEMETGAEEMERETEQTADEMEQEAEMEMEEGEEQFEDAQDLVDEAATVVQSMGENQGLQDLLTQARGVFIAPDYGKVAAGVGVRGGEGVLLVRQDGSWNGPAFYDIGAVSVGAQLGGTAGDIALVLMSDRAIDNFKEQNNFSFNADADLTLIDWSARGQESAGKGEDVVFWSDTEGAFAGVSLSATDIAWDDEENAAYYSEGVTPEDIFDGTATNPEASALRDPLPSGS